MRGWIRNPLVQFLVIVAAMFVVVTLTTARFSQRAADDEAISDARAVTMVLARSVAQPAIPRGLVDADPAAIDRMDQRATSLLIVGEVQRVKIWHPDGRILYSDDTRLINQRYELDEHDLAVLTTGDTEAEVSDLSEPENRFERGSGGLYEVYTRIYSPEGQPLLFEAYFSREEIDKERERIYGRFRPITFSALAAFTALTMPLLLLLMRRVSRTGEERERLLQSAVHASDAERLRIARDLHDGVVQDLAGASFALSTVAMRPDLPPDTVGELERVSRSVRASMRSLRSLLVEIYPPELRTEGLEAALTDLLSPLSTQGITTTLTVDEMMGVPDHAVALAWRVAQEAVRNAQRHAHASRIDVHVELDNDELVLRVTDDGTGFDVDAVAPGHFGLRGLQSLARDAGGRLEVVSARSEGTTVLLRVPVR